MSEQFFERRQQAFPKKYSALPGIGSTSPLPNDDNQIVGYSNGPRITEIGPDQSQLESRVSVAERSNRALLEECVRLQGELKMTVRRTDDMLAQERQHRQQMENSMRASNDLIAQLSARLAKAEDKMMEGSTALTSLSSQTKNMEQSFATTSQEQNSRKDQLQSKVLELRQELEQTQRAKDQLERVTYTLVDEMRQVKSKLESQNMDFNTVASDLRNKSNRLEEENRSTMETMRKQGDLQNQSEQTVGQLRTQVESRLGELRDVLVDLRSKQEQETQERRTLEQNQQMKMSDLQSAQAEQVRRRDELIHQLEVQQRERDHNAETDRLKMQSKLADISEELQQKLMQKEMKMREDTQKKIAEVEKEIWSMFLPKQTRIKDEEDERHKMRKQMKQEEDDRIEALSEKSKEEMREAKDQIKNETRKLKETTVKLNEAQNLLDKQFEESRKQQQKILSAEIQSRKKSEKEYDEKINSLQDKLAVATAALQQSIGGITNKVAEEVERLEYDMDELRRGAGNNNNQNKVDKRSMDELQVETRAAINERDAANARTLADIDARISALNSRLNHIMETVEGRIQNTLRRIQLNPELKEFDEAKKTTEDNAQEKLEALEEWKKSIQKTLDDLQAQNITSSEAVSHLQELLEKLQRELDDRVRGEGKDREKEVKKLRAEIANMAKPEDDDKTPPADTEAMQQSIRKLAESVQTVKTVLGMKIQSEQKLRVEDYKNLQEQLTRLKSLIDPLLKGGPKVFIKPEKPEGGKLNKVQVESDAPDINKWSMYSAYRWLKWKEPWMYILWRKEAEKKKRDEKEKNNDNDENKDKDSSKDDDDNKDKDDNEDKDEDDNENKGDDKDKNENENNNENNEGNDDKDDDKPKSASGEKDKNDSNDDKENNEKK